MRTCESHDPLRTQERSCTASKMQNAAIERESAVVNGSSLHVDTSSDQSRRRAAEKKQLKTQKRLGDEFIQAVSGSIQSFEHSMQSGSTISQKETAKQRRKQVKEVIKVVTDANTNMEDRLRFLQSKYVQLVEQLSQQDDEKGRLQAQLDLTNQNAAGVKEQLLQSQAKVDSLQRLSRSLQAEQKTEAAIHMANLEQFQKALHDLQLQITDQAEMNAVFEQCQALQEAKKTLLEDNMLLHSKVQELSQHLFSSEQQREELRTQHMQQLQDLAAKIEQQAEYLEKSRQLHEDATVLLEENQLLRQKAQLVDQLQKEKKLLEQLAEQYKTKWQQALDSFHKLDKLQKDTVAMLKKLQCQSQLHLAERDNLQQLVTHQADESHRIKLQKERLEGLCRVLQERMRKLEIQAASMQTADDGVVAEAAAHAQISEGQTAEEDTLPECRQVVQQALESIISQHACGHHD